MGLRNRGKGGPNKGENRYQVYNGKKGLLVIEDDEGSCLLGNTWK